MNITCFKFALFLAVLVVMASCKKHDFCDKPPKAKTCDLAKAFITWSDKETTRRLQYRKEYEKPGGAVSKVIAGIFTGSGLSDSVSLLLKYNGRDVYFVREDNPADTLLHALFNSDDKVVRIVSYLEKEDGWGNVTEEQYGFLTADFLYSSGRLEYVGSSAYPDLNVEYDANGNVVRMYDYYDDPNGGVFYTYDLSVTARRQFYADDFLFRTSNALYLAEFLGWTPDLMPKNKRVSVKVIQTKDYNPNNNVYNHTLTDHVYDANGNLLSY
ncbi:MAG TPA: hypothetical protein VM187_10440, partial [Niastella sp.]|nr:hypothetical protein [Niastella sp.]